MGKQYISTNTVAGAHSLDINDVQITSKYSITVSSDGNAQFYPHTAEMVQDFGPQHTKLIDTNGVHWISAYENSLPGSTHKATVLAFGCFSGRTRLLFYIDDNIDDIKDIAVPVELTTMSWQTEFYVDPESGRDMLIGTKVDGRVVVFVMTVTEDGVNLEASVPNGPPQVHLFPHSLAVSPTDPVMAVGYTSGDVVLYDLIRLQPKYTFRSTDLLADSTAIPRKIQFSPAGSLLAVARDNQSSGSITLYDVKYGENIGSLSKPSHSSGSGTSVGGFAHDGWIMGLSFDGLGQFIASCGMDKAVRVWNLDNREREATINLSITDYEEGEGNEMDESVGSGVEWVGEGLCVVSFDRGVRWYREAGRS